MNALGGQVIALDDLRRQRKQLDARIQQAQEELVRKMTQRGTDVVVLNDMTAKIVRPSREVVDEIGLRESLDPDTWKRITHRVYDSRKAEVALEEGYIDFTLLYNHIHIQQLAPYIRISNR